MPMTQGTMHARHIAASLALCAVLAPMPAAAAPRDATPAPAPVVDVHPCRLIGRGDLVFLALSAVAVGVAAHNDRWLTDEAIELHSAGEDHLAALAQPLGNPGLILPALAVTWGATRWSGHPDASGAVVRIGLSVGAAGAMALVLKEAVGRSRPSETPDDATNLHPFSGHESFPSGHAVVAFAAAAATDRETSAGWVPWVVYPGAALLGWSRVREHQHWTSDVVAGAAIGTWVGGKADDWLRCRHEARTRLGFELLPDPLEVECTLRF